MSIQRFPEKLRTLRERQNMSQRDLAKAIGFSQGHVYFVETGKRQPSAAFVFQVAQFFGVSTDQLLNDALELDLPEGA
jgi:transcriptional regulator with XRE-family HTH domain